MQRTIQTVHLGRNRIDQEAATSITELLRTHGYAYVADVPDGFDHLHEVQALGEPQPQYHGLLVRDIKPDPNIANDVLSAFNTAELTPHTELYEIPGIPPRYVVLWCVQPAADGTGETTLADSRELLASFSPYELAQLHTRIYRWRSHSTLTSEGIDIDTTHPCLERTDQGTVVRFSSFDVEQSDDLVKKYVASGRAHFAEHRRPIRIDRNALLIWDNWRMLHARNAFTDRRRHLKRVLLSVKSEPAA